MKRKQLYAAIFAVLLSLVLTRLYTFRPSGVSAVLSPVNSSIWEKTKLMFWPFLSAGLIFSLRQGRLYANILSAHFSALFIAQSILVLALTVFNRSAGLYSDFLDLSACLLALILGFLLSHFLIRSKLTDGFLPVTGFLTAALAACMILFTFHPPELGLFENPFTAVAGFYSV